jgi:hypothetical protein
MSMSEKLSDVFVDQTKMVGHGLARTPIIAK